MINQLTKQMEEQASSEPTMPIKNSLNNDQVVHYTPIQVAPSQIASNKDQSHQTITISCLQAASPKVTPLLNGQIQQYPVCWKGFSKISYGQTTHSC